MPQGPEWLTTGQVARQLQVAIATVVTYVDDGLLDEPVPAIKLPGGHRRIHRDSLARARERIYGSPPAKES